MTDFKHNEFHVTIDCIQQDVAYNLNMTLGDIHKKYSTFRLALDLTTPYSWIKKEDCTKCKDLVVEKFEEPTSTKGLKEYLSNLFKKKGNS